MFGRVDVIVIVYAPILVVEGSFPEVDERSIPPSFICTTLFLRANALKIALYIPLFGGYSRTRHIMR